MRKISPEEIPPLCPVCQAPMIVEKKWKCSGCGESSWPYHEKKVDKKNKKMENTKEFLHNFRKQIDACIQTAQNQLEILYQHQEEISEDRYIREMSLAMTKLQEAKMWVGKCLEAIGSEFPEELRDKAE